MKDEERLQLVSFPERSERDEVPIPISVNDVALTYADYLSIHRLVRYDEMFASVLNRKLAGLAGKT